MRQVCGTMGGMSTLPDTVALGPTNIYLYDLFAGTNGTAITSHTMNVGPGWTQSAGTATLNGTGAVKMGTAGRIVSDAGKANAQFVADFNFATTASAVGVAARWTDASNFWVCRLGASASVPGLSIYEVVAGAATQRAYTNVAFGTGTLWTMTGSVNGTAITCTVSTTTVNFAVMVTGSGKTVFGLTSDIANDLCSRFLVEAV